MAISKISDAQKEALQSAASLNLPYNPSAAGWKPEAILAALSKGTADSSILLANLINAIVDAVNAELALKENSAEGKGLSANDFTDTLKAKLDAIEAQANKTVVDSALSDSSTNPVQNKVVKEALDDKVDVVEGKALSQNDFTDSYKSKLDDIAEEANKTIVDDELSGSSENPVQNKVVKAALDEKYEKPASGIPSSDFSSAVQSTLSDVSNRALTSESGYSLDFSMDSNYVLTATLKNKAGETLSTKWVDLPIEWLLLGASVSGDTLTLTFRTGESDTQTVNVDLSGLLTTALAGKVDKETGKGLSHNDFTDAYKNKLDGIAAGATAVTVDSTLSGSSENPVQNKVVNEALGGKVDKVQGKGLSENDYTTAEKTKLAGIEAEANKTVVDSALSDSSENPVQNKVVKGALDGKLGKEGTAKQADQLLATVGVVDKVPYNHRPSADHSDIGDRENDEIAGDSVVWNQLISPSTYQQQGITVTLSNGIYTLSGETTSNFANIFDRTVPVVGHKYLFSTIVVSNPNGASGVKVSFNNAGGVPDVGVSIGSSGIINITSSNGGGFGLGAIVEGTDLTGYSFKAIVVDLTLMFGATIADYVYSIEQATTGDGVKWFRKLFPKDCYAYNAGSIQSVNVSSHDMVGFNQLNIHRTEGSTTNWGDARTTPRSWDETKYYTGVYTDYRFFSDIKGTVSTTNNTVTYTYTPESGTAYSYVAYPFRCFPNTEYNVHFDMLSGSTSTAIAIQYYDQKGYYLSNAIRYRDQIYTQNPSWTKLITTPANAYWLVVCFQSGTSDSPKTYSEPCVNIHWSGSRDGEYEPYVKHSYPLDSSLTLRGLLKLDTNNNLYADGDTYEGSGLVTRNYGERAYESGDENDSTVITDGTTTVYPLTTPTTEQATPFANPQIVNDWGTEEYVDYGVEQGTRDVAIPVGHVTLYPANLRDKLQHLPSLGNSGDGVYHIQQIGTQMYLVLDTTASRLTTAEGKITALEAKEPVFESYTIATSDWSALSSSDPYTYSTTVTATHTIGNDTLIELLNNNPVLFAKYGFAIGAVSGQTLTIYSIGEPDASVSLGVSYSG